MKIATCTNQESDKYSIDFPGSHNFTVNNNVVKFHGSLTVSEKVKDSLEVNVVLF